MLLFILRMKITICHLRWTCHHPCWNRRQADPKSVGDAGNSRIAL